MKSTLLPDNVLRRMSDADRLPLGKAGKTNAEIEAGIVAKSEKELQKQVANLLNQRGIVYFQSRFGKVTTMREGTPDFLFAIYSKACAVECKWGNGKLTDEQFALQVKMADTKNGWTLATVYSLEQFKQFLDQITFNYT